MRRLHCIIRISDVSLGLLLGSLLGACNGTTDLNNTVEKCALPVGDPRPSTASFAVEPFRMAVIGDSIAWGNGLSETDKAWTQFAQSIQEEENRPVLVQVHAYNGARVLEPAIPARLDELLSGEIPVDRSSIRQQVYDINDAFRQDLVIVSGCINDIGFENIINPGFSPEVLSTMVDEVCGTAMEDLLQDLQLWAGQARIIVLPYYSIVAEGSFGAGSLQVAQFLQLHGLNRNLPLQSLEQEAQNAMINLSRLFDERSRERLKDAVDSANETAFSYDRVVLANPQFKSEHAMFAPQSRLFGFTDEWDVGLGPGQNLSAILDTLGFGDYGVFPQDSLRDCRLPVCQEAVPNSQDRVLCIWASVGHPNVDGARAYSNAIRSAWKSLAD